MCGSTREWRTKAAVEILPFNVAVSQMVCYVLLHNSGCRKVKILRITNSTQMINTGLLPSQKQNMIFSLNFQVENRTWFFSPKFEINDLNVGYWNLTLPQSLWWSHMSQVKTAGNDTSLSSPFFVLFVCVQIDYLWWQIILHWLNLFTRIQKLHDNVCDRMLLRQQCESICTAIFFLLFTFFHTCWIIY